MKLKHRTVKIIIGLLISAIIIAGIIFALPSITNALMFVVRLFLPFIIAYLVALAANPLLCKMCRKLKMKRSLAAAIMVVLLIGGLGSLLASIIYKIVLEFKNLYQHFPQIYTNMLTKIDLLKIKLSGIYDVLPQNIQISLSDVGKTISDSAAKIINTKSIPVFTSAGSAALSLPTILVSVIVFLLATFFIMSDFEKVNEIVKKPFSDKTKQKFSLLSEQIKMYFGGYVKAQIIIMMIVFVILFIGFSIAGVQYALLIAIGTAVLDALPFFGTGAVLWPWTIVSFVMGDFKTGIIMIILYVIIIITRQSIEPKIVSKNIGLNPLLTLMSMYLGLKLLSIGGMILGPIIMMLIFSLYKAHIFDAPISAAIKLKNFIVERLLEIKNSFINFWKSE